MEKEESDFLFSFAEHGVEISGKGDQSIGSCPFCGKEGHFFVSRKTGLWDCKVCLESGNLYRFLAKSAEMHTKLTNDGKFMQLSLKRGIPWGRMKAAGMYFNGDIGHWMLPIFNKDKKLVDIRRYDGKKFMSTKNCSLHLFGEDTMGITREANRIWICEGEWDAMALRYLLQRVGLKDIVVGVPGAGTFKKEWANLFIRRSVILAYDNDEAGRKGAVKAAGLVGPVATKLEAVIWPESFPEKYDIRDLVKRTTVNKEPAVKVVADLKGMIGNSLERTDSFGKKETLLLNKSGKDEDKPKKPPITYPEVIDVFKEWVRVDQTFVDALAVCLAVCLSNEVPGDPIWMYLVAPPGAGKTLILMSMQNSHRTVFRSTLTPASLVSGFNADPDPSLLPQLDMKAAVFKDGTELLAMHPDAKRETYGILRGAFDGQVTKTFGNGVNRDYKLHFNMIIGMTPAVHGDSQATMGDRFLKFEMKETQEAVEEKIRAAITNISREERMGEALCDAVERFLNQEVVLSSIPRLPVDMIDRIVALAQILAALRAQVDREQFGDRDMRYRPVHEVGTRIAKQLSKLAMMLAMVYGRLEVDAIEYRLIQKVALDTAIGFHLDILAALVLHQKKEVTREMISYVTGLPMMTVQKRLLDMEQLGLVGKHRMEKWKGTGLAPTLYRPTPLMMDLWSRAAVDWGLIRLRKLPTIANPSGFSGKK